MKYLMLIFCFTNVLAQNRNEDFLPNECWAIKDDISRGAVISGISGTIYNFHDNGKFEATNYYSGGVYFSELVKGNYRYNPILDEVILIYNGVKSKRTKPIRKAKISLSQSKNKYILSTENEYVKGGQGINKNFDGVIDFDIKTVIPGGFTLSQSEGIKGDLTQKRVTFSRTKIIEK